jgi:AcrR family transcriptional regulator
MPGTKAPEETRRDQILQAAYRVALGSGIDGLTIRRVASAAGLSSGLVLFHFKTKAQLLLGLLDWLLQQTLVLPGPLPPGGPGAPRDHFMTLLREEMTRLASDPRRIRLLFEFWVRGDRNKAIGDRMRRELVAYREAFGPVARQVLAAEPRRFSGVSAEGLASLAVSFIKGCAVQSMIDPGRFDLAEYLRAAAGLLGRGAPSPDRPGADSPA